MAFLSLSDSLTICKINIQEAVQLQKVNVHSPQ